MRDSRRRLIASSGLVVGAVFGIAGTFAPAPMRGLAWGIDGIALIVASAMLAIHYFREGNDTAAAGFLVFLAGETLIVSGAAMELAATAPSFAAGAGLWAASLALVSSSNAMPRLLRGIGFVASLLFAVVAVEMFSARPLTPLSQPLPFLAYPFLAATLVGWAWVHYKRAGGQGP
jgi:hypothetical protein